MSAYRYPGIKPFESSEKNQFFGRDNDINRLSKIINTEKLVVLYSKSGLGKSSLLNAGIIPNLEKSSENEVFKIRFGSFIKGTSIEPLKVSINTIRSQKNSTKGLAKVLDKLNIGSKKTYLDKFSENKSALWQELKKAQQQKRSIKNFVLIFDQFEELFSYPTDKQEDLPKALSEILYPVIPQPIREEIENKIKNDPNFISDDEKELLFTPLSVKIVVAIRSDRMSLLDKIRDFIPDIFNRFYELKSLSREQAKEAVLIPASLQNIEKRFTSNTFGYKSLALNKMLAFLSKEGTQEIETFQLQILCSHLEKKVIEKNLKEIGIDEITNIGDIYKNFYDNILNQLTAREQKYIRNFIEEGLIFEDDERRLNLYEGQIYKNYHVKPKLLRWLVDTHIIRAEPSMKGGYIYELSHDSLIRPILESKRQNEKGKYKGLSKKEIELKKKLERIIEERTLEIEGQKESVMMQRDEIESQRDQIRMQHDLVSNQKREIVESILYASRIQNAMLTPEEYIQEILSDFFVLNLPKSIVSGDFYWVKKIQNSIYVAVADCTGHGIPGAMVSLLGMSFLKEIFKNDLLIDVNLVLDELLKNFIRSLRQTGKEERIGDGMDISLCQINTETLQLQYAGAYNPIYIIREGELMHFRGDRQPIAMHFKGHESFTKQTIQLQKNDSIYLFTDGYIDQFGESDGRKFMARRFKKLLISLQDLSMKEQREKLIVEYDKWRGNVPQVDDIVIFGIKYNFE